MILSRILRLACSRTSSNLELHLAENADQRWLPDNAGKVLCARVAQEVYRHFAAKAKAAAGEKK